MNILVLRKHQAHVQEVGLVDNAYIYCEVANGHQGLFFVEGLAILTRVLIRYRHEIFLGLEVLHRDGLRSPMRRISHSIRNSYQESFNHTLVPFGLSKPLKITIPTLCLDLRDRFWRVKAVAYGGFLMT